MLPEGVADFLLLGGTKMKGLLLALVVALSMGFCMTGCKKEEPQLPEGPPDIVVPPEPPAE